MKMKFVLFQDSKALKLKQRQFEYKWTVPCFQLLLLKLLKFQTVAELHLSVHE